MEDETTITVSLIALDRWKNCDSLLPSSTVIPLKGGIIAELPCPYSTSERWAQVLSCTEETMQGIQTLLSRRSNWVTGAGAIFPRVLLSYAQEGGDHILWSDPIGMALERMGLVRLFTQEGQSGFVHTYCFNTGLSFSGPARVAAGVPAPMRSRKLVIDGLKIFFSTEWAKTTRVCNTSIDITLNNAPGACRRTIVAPLLPVSPGANDYQAQVRLEFPIGTASAKPWTEEEFAALSLTLQFYTDFCPQGQPVHIDCYSRCKCGSVTFSMAHIGALGASEAYLLGDVTYKPSAVTDPEDELLSAFGNLYTDASSATGTKSHASSMHSPSEASSGSCTVQKCGETLQLLLFPTDSSVGLDATAWYTDKPQGNQAIERGLALAQKSLVDFVVRCKSQEDKHRSFGAAVPHIRPELTRFHTYIHVTPFCRMPSAYYMAGQLATPADLAPANYFAFLHLLWTALARENTMTVEDFGAGKIPLGYAGHPVEYAAVVAAVMFTLYSNACGYRGDFQDTNYVAKGPWSFLFVKYRESYDDVSASDGGDCEDDSAFVLYLFHVLEALYSSMAVMPPDRRDPALWRVAQITQYYMAFGCMGSAYSKGELCAHVYPFLVPRTRVLAMLQEGQRICNKKSNRYLATHSPVYPSDWAALASACASPLAALDDLPRPLPVLLPEGTCSTYPVPYTSDQAHMKSRKSFDLLVSLKQNDRSRLMQMEKTVSLTKDEAGPFYDCTLSMITSHFRSKGLAFGHFAIMRSLASDGAISAHRYGCKTTEFMSQEPALALIPETSHDKALQDRAEAVVCDVIIASMIRPPRSGSYGVATHAHASPDGKVVHLLETHQEPIFSLGSPPFSEKLVYVAPPHSISQIEKSIRANPLATAGTFHSEQRIEPIGESNMRPILDPTNSLIGDKRSTDIDSIYFGFY